MILALNATRKEALSHETIACIVYLWKTRRAKQRDTNYIT